MIFQYYQKRGFYLYALLYGLILFGLSFYRFWDAIGFSGIRQVSLYIGIFLVASGAYGYIFRPRQLAGDCDFLYVSWLYGKKKFPWTEIVSIRFEKEVTIGNANRRTERRDYMVIKSVKEPAFRLEITDLDALRDDIAFECRKRNPKIKINRI